MVCKCSIFALKSPSFLFWHFWPSAVVSFLGLWWRLNKKERDPLLSLQQIKQTRTGKIADPHYEIDGPVSTDITLELLPNVFP